MSFRFLPVGILAGVGIQPHTTRTVRAQFLLPIEKGVSSQLVGRHLSCIGLDWHGNPPV
jgi:hypothetical protein